MTVQLQEKAEGKVLEIQATGKLTVEDYGRFLPEIERLIERFGKLNLLFEMHDFHGWKAGALWEDFKFDFKHFRDIGRLALVGEKKWQKGMATFCKPFTTAKVRYFDSSEMDDARQWVAEGSLEKVPHTT
jgi:SpoIIAA-like